VLFVEFQETITEDSVIFELVRIAGGIKVPLLVIIGAMGAEVSVGNGLVAGLADVSKPVVESIFEVKSVVFKLLATT